MSLNSKADGLPVPAGGEQVSVIGSDSAPKPEPASILLVDDTRENLIAFEAVLSSAQYRIVLANSGREALQALLREDFAVVLLDVNMPEMNGFETASLIRQRPNSEHTPIIFVSAISTTETHAHKAYSLGAVDYIFTPIVPEILRSKVSVFVELYNKSQESKKANRELEQEMAVRKRAEAALKETNAELEAFAYSVSHDLRAPLRAMQGFAQALREDCASQLGAEGLDYADRIISAAMRLDALIQDLLLYSRLAHNNLELTTIDTDRVLEEALAQLEAPIADANASVVLERPLFRVRAHYSTLLQIVGNLVSNAIKFVNPGSRPQVRIWMESFGAMARLNIQDNGIGIPSEFHQRIFRVFERLHGVEAYPGTGVGLAIVRKGVERMQGNVGLESTPEKGSRFWIELPLAEA